MTARQTQIAMGLFLVGVLAGLVALWLQYDGGRSPQTVSSVAVQDREMNVTWYGSLCGDTSTRLTVDESATTINVLLKVKQGGDCEDCLCPQTVTTRLDAPLSGRAVTSGSRQVRIE